MRMRGLLLVCLLVMAGCGRDAEPGATPTTEAPDLAISPPAAVPSPAAAYPRIIFTQFIEDIRVENHIKDFVPGITEVIEISPGIYAELGQSRSLDPTIYSPIFGRCPDVVEYQRAHPDHHASSSCV
jgi:hypothetical protein